MRATIRRTASIVGAVVGAGALVTGAAVPVTVAVGPSAAPAGSTSSCHLGNGVRHVINITFDNVHFFRDNPNVPSDLEQMPTLMRFLERNGVVMSNMHTPLIAHTAEDSLAIYSGLYGDRHGQPVSNTYKSYRPDGTTEPDTSFVYWTSPVINNATKAPSTVNKQPSMVYSPTVPAANATPGQIAPEPWVAYNKAGCSFGAFSSANMVLENNGDIPTVFGSPAPSPAPYFNTTSAFIGEAVHCGLGDTRCEQANGAVVDNPPPANNPGTATYRALFGHKFVQPMVTANATAPSPYRVADNAGNLVDLDNRELADFAGHPGFPGFSPTASQTLSMLASMQEAGVPVTFGYIADVHERKDWSFQCTTADATAFGNALGPGDSCYEENLQRYDQAFAKFLDRLAKDGIGPNNTLFVIGAEENDHFAGANVGRADAPQDPANCDGVTTPCRYGHNQVGEVQANIVQLLAQERGNSTPFDIEPQGASIYVHNPAGQPVSPPANDPAVRQLERDTAALTANNPHSGVNGETIMNFQAGATAQRILHLQSADPQRTPTYSLFPKPDYFFDAALPNCTGSTKPAADCVSVSSRFAWNHGYYSPDIDITWSSFVGPGVKKAGIDGPSPVESPEVAAPDGGGLVPDFSTRGTWADETDIRPTMLYVAGLSDDYIMDGRVISEILHGNGALKQIEALGDCYKQLNASVGEFGTSTLVASTAALASGSAVDDSTYTRLDAKLAALGSQRDALATTIKQALDNVAFHNAKPDRHAITQQLDQCTSLLSSASQLADSATS
jgi:hypothetical protein